MHPASSCHLEPPPTAHSIRVALVEDDPVQRAEMLEFLRTVTHLEVAGAWPSAEAAAKGLPGVAADVVLVDIGLPGASGVDLVRQLKPRLPDTQFMMLTVFEDADAIFGALEAGATGYLLKKTVPRRLVEAIEELHAGGSPMSAAIARRLIDQFKSAAPSGTSPSAAPDASSPSLATHLSPREREILDLLGKGHLYKEIAQALGIAEGTVRTHIRRTYMKLHARNRMEAVRRGGG